MKNTVKLFGIIVLVALIGFSIAGCGDMDESDSSTDGRLTITGLNSYNGWKMWLLSGSDQDNEANRLFLMSKNNPQASDAGQVSITGDSVTVYVWKPWIREGKSQLWHSYKGNDQNVKFGITLEQGQNSVNGSVTASFSSGKATAAFVPNP